MENITESQKELLISKFINVRSTLKAMVKTQTITEGDCRLIITSCIERLAELYVITCFTERLLELCIISIEEFEIVKNRNVPQNIF